MRKRYLVGLALLGLSAAAWPQSTTSEPPKYDIFCRSPDETLFATFQAYDVLAPHLIGQVLVLREGSKSAFYHIPEGIICEVMPHVPSEGDNNNNAGH